MKTGRNILHLVVGCAALVLWPGLTGCSIDINPPVTCLEGDGSCEDWVPGGTDTGNTSSDADMPDGADDTSVADGDASVTDTDNDTTETLNCMETFGYCKLDEACEDAPCQAIVGVWPPPDLDPWRVRDAYLNGSVNMFFRSEKLYFSTSAWLSGDDNHKLIVARADVSDGAPNDMSSYVPQTFGPLDFNPLDVRADNFYEAPAMGPLLHRPSGSAQMLLLVPHLELDSNGRLRMAHKAFDADASGLDSVEVGTEVGNGGMAIELLSVVEPSHFVQPALFNFTNNDGEAWSGWQYQGRVEHWNYYERDMGLDDKLAAKQGVNRSATSLAEACNGTASPRTSSMTVLENVSTARVYADCYTTEEESALSWFSSRADNDLVSIDVEGVWAGVPVTPTVTALGSSPFMARVVKVATGVRLQVVHDLNSDEPQTYTMNDALQNAVDIASDGEALTYCPSLTDGIALANIDDTPEPEIIVLARLALDCTPAANVMEDQNATSFLIRYRWTGSALEVIPFGPPESPVNFARVEVGYATGPLVADLDGDGEQDFVVGLLQDVTPGRRGSMYGVRVIDADGSVGALPSITNDATMQTVESDGEQEAYFELPVAIGDFYADVPGFELSVLRMYGRGSSIPTRDARVVIYSLPNATEPEWAMRMSDSGQTGLWPAQDID